MQSRSLHLTLRMMSGSLDSHHNNSRLLKVKDRFLDMYPGPVQGPRSPDCFQDRHDHATNGQSEN